MNFKYELHLNDLPSETSLKNATTIAIDGEFSGLNPLTDKLHLLQLCDGSDMVHFVKFNGKYNAPHLKSTFRERENKKNLSFW
jgi:ribonuclease D